MKTETLAALAAFFAEFPFLKAEPVPRAEVDAAFAKVHFPLPNDYKHFVEVYGGAIVGPYRIYGLRRSKPMGNDEESALAVTEQFSKQSWPGVENWLVISTDHCGNPIGMAADGKVWISDHDLGQIAVVAESFDEFISGWCLNLAKR